MKRKPDPRPEVARRLRALATEIEAGKVSFETLIDGSRGPLTEIIVSSNDGYSEIRMWDVVPLE